MQELGGNRDIHNLIQPNSDDGSMITGGRIPTISILKDNSAEVDLGSLAIDKGFCMAEKEKERALNVYIFDTRFIH